jgi:hypothetical protein
MQGTNDLFRCAVCANTIDFQMQLIFKCNPTLLAIRLYLQSISRCNSLASTIIPLQFSCQTVIGTRRNVYRECSICTVQSTTNYYTFAPNCLGHLVCPTTCVSHLFSLGISHFRCMKQLPKSTNSRKDGKKLRKNL